MTLANLGATCYFNSVCQSLASCEELVHFLVDRVRAYAPRVRGERPVIMHVRELLETIVREPDKVIRPAGILQILRERGVVTPGQQDAQEFYVTLIDALDRDLGELDAFRDILHGATEREVECPNPDCAHKHVNHESFLTIDLPLRDECDDLVELARAYHEPSVLDGEWTCDRCGVRTSQARSATRVTRYPPIVTICLKRFRFEGSRVVKDPRPVRLPLVMEIGGKRHALRAYVVHSGSATNGHYVCVANRNGTWKLIDDEHTHSIRQDPPETRDAYLAFYQLA